METKVIEISYAEIVNMRLIDGKTVQEVADAFEITWEEAVAAIRGYGFKVAKDEKKPAQKPKSYRVELITKEKVVATEVEPKKTEPKKEVVKSEGVSNANDGTAKTETKEKENSALV